jgi:hypothetical protein
MSVLLVLAVAAALANAPAASPSSLSVSPKAVDMPAVANGSPPMKQDVAGDPQQMICKRVMSTGTRFTTKDCRTRAEWNQLTADSRQATLDMTSRQNGFSN